MNIKKLEERIARLNRTVEPPPMIIDCTGAREELITKLRSHMTPEELYEVDNGPHVIDEETQRQFDVFHAFLTQNVKDIEQQYNVRFVSNEQR